MKKTIKSLLSIMSVLALSNCTFSSDALFPSLFGTDMQENTVASNKANGPQLGTTNFEPLEVSQGGSTGTLVGQKVITFRKELSQIQNAIRANNDELQKVRGSIVANATQYHKLIGGIEAKLQVGTTPGNPHMYAMLQSAQNHIQIMNANAITLNQVSQRVSSDAGMTTYLFDSIKAAFLVSGAVDEDHRQLRILENETAQTSILIQSLLAEVNSDYARQQQYVDTAGSYILQLNNSIKVGNFMGSPLAGSKISSASALGLPSGSPLLVIKFNKSTVDFTQPLKQAVSAAKAKGSTNFDVVAVQGNSGGSSKAKDVFQEIVNLGVPAENITLSATSNPAATSSEVHIFVR